MATKKQKPARQRTERMRTWTRVVIILIVSIGLIAGVGFGTLSGFGWEQVSLLCPLGALTTMLASKTLVPRAIISLVVGVALIVLLGRAFCGWLCPVPLVSQIRTLFEPKRRTKAENPEGLSKAQARAIKRDLARAKREAEHKAFLREVRTTLDSRHIVLGGSIIAALAFGFPVFCLVCPIGLTFATVLLVARAFGAADASWTLVVVPALLIVEVVVFRNWCHTICPLGGLMSLLARANRTAQPQVDARTCLEMTTGKQCGACARACPEGIDLRHLAESNGLNECLRCRRCVDVCPTHAINMPLLAKKTEQP